MQLFYFEIAFNYEVARAWLTASKNGQDLLKKKILIFAFEKAEETMFNSIHHDTKYRQKMPGYVSFCFSLQYPVSIFPSFISLQHRRYKNTRQIFFLNYLVYKFHSNRRITLG